MTVEELEALFEEVNGEFLKFDRVAMKLSSRPDLHAFLILASLFPDTGDIVNGAEHDEIYLSVESDQLAAVATRELVIELHRCGVRLGEYGLCMFV